MSESVLLSEIAEQPSVLDRLLTEAASEVEAIAATVRARNIHHVVIAARGSSDNAARYAQYLFGAHNRLTVTLATPSLFTRYQTPPVMTGALVIGISQSGESPDLIAVVEEGRRQGCPTLAVTNVAGSPLTAAADHTIVLRAGKERSIAATKTYTAQLAALAMLSTAMAQQDEWRRELAQVPSFVAAAHAVNREIVLSAAAALQHAGHGVVLGRGFNFATAFEAALKAKELAYVAVEPYSSAYFQHGPIALINPNMPTVALVPKDSMYEKMISNIQEIKARKGSVLAIVTEGDELIRKMADYVLEVPDTLPPFSGILAVIPLQLLSYHIAVLRGCNVDQPRNLAKSVTVE